MKIPFLCILLLLMPCAVQSQTFTEVIPIPCGDTSLTGGLGYPTWNIPVILSRPGYGHASLIGDFIQTKALQYIAPPWFAGMDTVIVQCAHATQITCQTGIYIFDVSCPEVTQPVYAGEVDCRDSVYMPYLSGWAAPALIQDAHHGQAHIILEPADGAGVAYRPNPGFEGLDWVRVSLFQGQDTALFLFQVYCNLASATREAAMLRPHHYPNPASDFLYVQVAMPANPVVRVFDVMGRRFNVPIQLIPEGIELNVSRLSAGKYWVSGWSEEGIIFVINFAKMN